jgi:hypothetical protein
VEYTRITKCEEFIVAYFKILSSSQSAGETNSTRKRLFLLIRGRGFPVSLCSVKCLVFPVYQFMRVQVYSCASVLDFSSQISQIVRHRISKIRVSGAEIFRGNPEVTH